jgi:hypothetical protein
MWLISALIAAMYAFRGLSWGRKVLDTLLELPNMASGSLLCVLQLCNLRLDIILAQCSLWRSGFFII